MQHDVAAPDAMPPVPARFPGADPDESRQQLVVHEGIFGTQA